MQVSLGPEGSQSNPTRGQEASKSQGGCQILTILESPVSWAVDGGSCIQSGRSG